MITDNPLAGKIFKSLQEETQLASQLAAALENLLEVAEKNLGTKILAIQQARNILGVYDEDCARKFSNLLKVLKETD